jgi:hypothetical protein
MLHDKAARWVQKLDHFGQAHFIEGKCKQIDNYLFGGYSLRERIIELFGWVVKYHILSLDKLLRWSHLHLIWGLHNLSRPMRTRPSHQHAYPGCKNICLTHRNCYVYGLAEGWAISLVDIDDRISFEIVDSTYDFVPVLRDRHDEPFRDFGWASGVLNLDMHTHNFHNLLWVVLLLAINTINHVELGGQLIGINILVEGYESDISKLG